MANIAIGNTVKLIGISACNVHPPVFPRFKGYINGYVCGMDPETVVIVDIMGDGTIIGENGKLYPMKPDNDDFYAVVSVTRPVPCNVCGEPMTPGGTRETLVGYISPPGHDHDDNCQYRVYECKNGHKMEVYKRRRCSYPGCTWVGQETCSCHEGPKVDKWPEEV